MDAKYDQILKEIQKEIFLQSHENERSFYDNVVKKCFIAKMDYERGVSKIEEKDNTFRKADLLIKGSKAEKPEKALSVFSRQVGEENCVWGILIHSNGIWLINSDIRTNTISSFTNSNIVLEIRFGSNINQKYFKYFSQDNIIGKKRNACFFRDIIDYKNNYYKGKEKSWPGYESALKRFFDFFSEQKGDYECAGNIYDTIQFAFFVEFIRKETKCKSLKSVRNSFFYIKDFIQLKSGKNEFGNAEQVKKNFPELLPKYEMQDIMCIDKLAKALQYLNANQNGTRNKTILLLFLAYGIERGKLCSLKWKNIMMGERKIEIKNKQYPIPGYLWETLTQLKKQNSPEDYVFCNKNGDPLSAGTVNIILSNIAKADREDSFYRQLTPANIRRCLAQYLLEHDYPLQEIFYLMDIEGYKLESYIPRESMEMAVWRMCKDRIYYMEGQHPMEGFLEKLRQAVEMV